MEKLTATGNTIASISQEKMKLDRQIKKVLACKPILAIILKETVAECKGLFYCCRMISSQLETEFTVHSSDKKKYQNIKKVYSIWICTDTSDKRRDSVEKYSLNKEMLFGHNDDDHRYDLMSAIIVNVGKNYNDHDTDSRMLNVLSVLVDDTMDASKKLRLLRDRYDVPVTSEIKKEVEYMCTYTASVEANGEARGEAKLAKLIECLIKANRNADIEKAVTNENERKKFYREFDMID